MLEREAERACDSKITAMALFQLAGAYRFLFIRYATKTNPTSAMGISNPGSGLPLELLDWAVGCTVPLVLWFVDVGAMLTALPTPA